MKDIPYPAYEAQAKLAALYILHPDWHQTLDALRLSFSNGLWLSELDGILAALRDAGADPACLVAVGRMFRVGSDTKGGEAIPKALWIDG